jgi:hypothetical protein
LNYGTGAKDGTEIADVFHCPVFTSQRNTVHIYSISISQGGATAYSSQASLKRSKNSGVFGS